MREDHAHNMMCRPCRLDAFDFLLSPDSFMTLLPREIAAKIMACVGQHLCGGCSIVRCDSQLMPVESPEDISNGWFGPYCRVAEAVPSMWFWASPHGACVWRWLPKWCRVYLASGDRLSHLKIDGKLAALAAKLNYRITCRK